MGGFLSDIANAIIPGRSERKAANAQEAAANRSINFQEENRDLAREDLEPFRSLGIDIIPKIKENLNGSALDNELLDILNARSLPSISESRAAAGLFDSAGTREALSDRLTDNFILAGPNLNQQKFNQLFSLLNLGQSSAAGQANTAIATGGGISNNIENIGNIKAQRIQSSANETKDFIESLVKADESKNLFQSFIKAASGGL